MFSWYYFVAGLNGGIISLEPPKWYLFRKKKSNPTKNESTKMQFLPTFTLHLGFWDESLDWALSLRPCRGFEVSDPLIFLQN